MNHPLDTVFRKGTILSCPDCGEGLYKVQQQTTTKDLVLDSASLLVPLNTTIPPLDSWHALSCPLCGGRLFQDGQIYTLQHGWQWEEQGMGRIISACLLMSQLAYAALAQPEERNDCHNPAAHAHWEATVAKHPGDLELHTLHALWLGLCHKVDRKDITAAQAIDIFEKARQTMVQQRQEEQQREEQHSSTDS